MKVLVTGGHIGCALACIDELKKNETIDIVFTGRKYNTLREKTESLEYKEVTARKIPFFNIHAGRISRIISAGMLINLLTIPVGFIEALYYILISKPDVVLSFGGYIALPVAVAGWITGKKVYTHEQTIHPGTTNRIISFFARKIFVSFEESKKYFSSKKVLVTGNPIRSVVFSSAKHSFNIPDDQPVIYVTGGSLGSHSINEHIRGVISQLVEDYTVVHQCGNVQEFDDYKNLQSARESLPEKLKERYILKEHIQAGDIGYVYEKADLVIGRAGANTFFELVALKKPSILIPLPWSAYGEQQKQAELLHSHEVAEIFNQSDTSRNLLKLIDTVMKNIEKYKKNYSKLTIPHSTDAAATITKEILTDS